MASEANGIASLLRVQLRQLFATGGGFGDFYSLKATTNCQMTIWWELTVAAPSFGRRNDHLVAESDGNLGWLQPTKFTIKLPRWQLDCNLWATSPICPTIVGVGGGGGAGQGALPFTGAQIVEPIKCY